MLRSIHVYSLSSALGLAGFALAHLSTAASAQVWTPPPPPRSGPVCDGACRHEHLKKRLYGNPPGAPKPDRPNQKRK